MKTFLRSLLFLVMTSFVMASTVTIDFTTLPSNTANGYYVGFAGANVTSGNTIFNNLQVICDDFGHTTSFPSGNLQYDVSTLTSLTDTRFTQSPEIANYETAAILVYELANGGQADAGGYQFALWKLFTPSAGNYGDSASLLTAAKALQVAGGSFTADAYSNLEVFTPAACNLGNQEFLALDFPVPNSPVPEPTTMGLMGVGLLGIGLFKRKRIIK